MSEEVINLPYGYKRCLYLESTGTQYIDTNIIPTIQTGAYAKWSLTNIKNYSNVLTCLGISRDDTADNVFMLPHWNGYNNAYLGGFMSRTSGVLRLENQTAPTLQSIHESYLNYHNNGQAFIDATLLGNVDNTYENLENDLPLYLFGCNKLNSLSTGDSMIGRIYRATITEGENIVMDLIPCLDDNGKPCMYDLVTQTPFYNANAEGNDFRYVVKGKIPSGYKRLKYLKSTGTQYIDTGIVTDGTYTISTKFCINEIRGNHGIWGRNVNNSKGSSYAGAFKPSTYALLFSNHWSGGLYDWAVDIFQPHEYILTEGQKNIIVDGETKALKALNTNAVNSSNPNNYPHYLFRGNNMYSYVSFYNFRMQNGEGKIVLDFVPALDENGRPCMYDLVEGIPYYNAGTGEFKCPPGSLETDYKKYCTLGVIGNRLGGGEDGLPPTYKRVNYLQSTGTQYIDTGIATDGTYTVRTKMQFSLGSAWGRAFKTADYDIGGCSFCRRITNSGYYCMNFLYYWNGGVYGNRPGFTDVEWDINEPNVWEAKEGKTYVLVNGQLVHMRHFNTLKVDASNPNNLTHYVFWANGIFTNGAGKATMKLYDFQMINGSGKIVLDFIPCLDDNGRPCMFDRIANKTFYNKGTGEFLYG